MLLILRYFRELADVYISTRAVLCRKERSKVTRRFRPDIEHAKCGLHDSSLKRTQRKRFNAQFLTCQLHKKEIYVNALEQRPQMAQKHEGNVSTMKITS